MSAAVALSIAGSSALHIVLATTDQQVADATRQAAWASITVALATGALAIFTFLLAKQAKRSAKDAEAALGIAREQAAASMIQAQTAQESFRAAHLPTLTLTQEPYVESRFLDQQGYPIVRVAAKVHSLGPGAARVEDALLLVSNIELPLTRSGDILPAGATASFFVLLNETHPAAEQMIAGRSFGVLSVRYSDVTGYQHQVLRAEKRRDETLISNAFE